MNDNVLTQEVPIAPDAELRIRAEKTRLLFTNQRRSYLLSIVTALVPVMLARQSELLVAGLIWFGLFLVVATVRHAVTRRYLSLQPPPEHTTRWTRYYVLGAAAAGALWGGGALLLAMHSAVLFQLITLFLAYGLVAAAVPLLGSHRGAMLAFQIPTLAPVTLWALFNIPDIQLLIAFVMALYLAGIRISQGQLESYIGFSQRLRLENQGLITQLNTINSRLQDSNRELTRLSERDPLTGLANRRHYEDRLAAEWRRAAREHGRLALLVIDVDYFKRYNDSLGHAAGDRCLREIASVVQLAAQRPGDLAARYGGEEFVLLLPDTDLAGALALAEGLAQRIRDAALPHPNSPLSNYVTVSIGAAALPATGNDPKVLFKVADEGLYTAKAGGRDQVRAGPSVGAALESAAE